MSHSDDGRLSGYRELIDRSEGAEFDEALRERAYVQGRAALAAGVGPAELTIMHQQFTADLLSRLSVGGDRLAVGARTDGVLAEALAPYEMALRGYQETNEALTRAVSEARAATRELDSFAHSVSHDLRAPLRAIDGFSATLDSEFGAVLDERGRDRLARIRAAAQRMSALIDGLLTISRASRALLEPGLLDLSAIAREISEELARVEPERAVEWKIEDNVSALGDAALLRALLENLLNNAWKFSAHRDLSEIAFGQREIDGERVLFVQDNGAGFDMANSDHLFTAFQRLHAASEYDGTGIGLATVQRIVNRHGGRVWAEAEVHRGATFCWTLADLTPQEMTDAW